MQRIISGTRIIVCSLIAIMASDIFASETFVIHTDEARIEVASHQHQPNHSVPTAGHDCPFKAESEPVESELEDETVLGEAIDLSLFEFHSNIHSSFLNWTAPDLKGLVDPPCAA